MHSFIRKTWELRKKLWGAFWLRARLGLRSEAIEARVMSRLHDAASPLAVSLVNTLPSSGVSPARPRAQFVAFPLNISLPTSTGEARGLAAAKGTTYVYYISTLGTLSPPRLASSPDDILQNRYAKSKLCFYDAQCNVSALATNLKQCSADLLQCPYRVIISRCFFPIRR